MATAKEIDQSRMLLKVAGGLDHGGADVLPPHADRRRRAIVRSQIKAILQKLEVSSQLAAVAAARRAGWSPDEHLPRR